jgi:hypothetical protein
MWAIDQLCDGKNPNYSDDPDLQDFVERLVSNYRNEFGEEVSFELSNTKLETTTKSAIVTGIGTNCYEVDVCVDVPIKGLDVAICEPTTDNFQLLELYTLLLANTPEYTNYSFDAATTSDKVVAEIEKAENLLNDLAPKGHWFGKHPDDNTIVGFWKY